MGAEGPRSAATVQENEISKTMTNSEILKVIIDLIGTNLHTHKAIAQVIGALSEDKQEEISKTLSLALKSNKEAFDAINNSVVKNG